jgi:fatty-acyl-CoA synthase
MPSDTITAWLEGLTISEALDRTFADFADRDALVFPRLNLRLTYQQFAAQIDQAARGLLACGIKRSEHVAIWSTNLPEWVLLQFATARIGAVLVTINPAYRAHELKYVLKQSDAAALVLTDRYKSSDYSAMLAEVCPEFRNLPGSSGNSPSVGKNESALDDAPYFPEFPKLRRVITIKGPTPHCAISWQQLMSQGDRVPLDEVRRIARLLKPTDVINIQYTSGTTGFPKAAMLSHRNLLLNVYFGGICQALTQHDRICIPVPFYHCFGCVLGTLMAAVHGAAMVIPAESFEPAATLDAIETERCTSLYGVPTMFIAQLNDATLPGRDLKSLRTGIMAGSPCPIETMRAVVNTLGCREITIGYGQTEASPIITQTRTDDPIELRVETVGRPLPGLEVKIVDPATGQEIPQAPPVIPAAISRSMSGAIDFSSAQLPQGELCARGHCVMVGYYNNLTATQEAVDSDGWLHTGDLAVRLANGYYKITGRIKDLVIRGGENIYPREIEEFLFTHPAVEQAAVVGVPDPKYGEELCAWIKLKPGATVKEEEVREFCRAKLARFKVPRYVKFVAAFPQTVTGKIQKFKIREQMREELGLSEQPTA